MNNKLLDFWKKYSFTVFILFIFLGMFDVRFAIAAIACMLAPIILALAGNGRFWCGNLCPRGNFFDRVLKKFSNNKKAAPLLRSNAFRFLVIAFMFTMFGMGLHDGWGDLRKTGMVFYRMIVMTSLVGIALSPFYNHRSWCHFCPMGSIAAFITRIKGKKVKIKVDSSCVSCNSCARKCPMGMQPKDYKNGYVEAADCIICGECIPACPKKSISIDKQ